MDLTFDFSAIQKEMDKLDAKLKKTGLRQSARKAMKPVLDEMKRNALEDTGVLKSTIKMRTSAARGRTEETKNRVLTVRVGVMPKRNEQERRRIQAALAQEFGTERQQAQPFIRPALHNSAQRVLDTLKTELGEFIRKNAK